MTHLESLFCIIITHFLFSISMHSTLCFFFCFFFLFAATFCHGSDLTTVEVVGVGECADCHKNNIKTSHAFSGLHVSIECKQKDGGFKRKGVAELDEEGKFKVLLPMTEVLKDGKLKEKCFAKLHSASSTPCSSSHDGLELASMIVLKSKGEGKQTFDLPGGLKFKSANCVSAFFWHYFHHPPLPPISIHPITFPPHHPLLGHPYVLPPFHHKYFSPPIPENPPPVYEPPPVPEKPPPIYEKPPPVYEKPPPVYEKPPPVYKPKPPVYKPKPPVYKPPAPVYKPKPPVYKPKPPVYKPKPPVYKPKPPVYKPKPPVYVPKPPVYKPKPPVYHKHPWFKHLPPISKLPPCPPVPKVIPIVHPKYFPHPKLGKKFPPLPPSVPHP